jgi:Asp-tRNA(Asn)/Glu-tRNA(Gln) amidotransferase A subunit family amidase
MDFEAAHGLAWERFNHSNLLSDLLRDTFAAAAATPREEYDAAMRRARVCRQLIGASFADCDVLLTPSAPAEAPAGIHSTGSSLFNRSWTLLGLPCVTLPAGRGASGLPLGVQFVGNCAEDGRVLRAAEWARMNLPYQGH